MRGITVVLLMGIVSALNLRRDSHLSPAEEPTHLRLDMGYGQMGVYLPESQATSDVDYGTGHPFGATYVEEPFEKLRISFHGMLEESLMEALEEKVLVEVRRVWSNALSVAAVRGSIFPYSSKCGEVNVPVDHLMKGVSGGDLVVYLSSSKEYCRNTGAYASICTFDQHMRPIAGNIAICTEELSKESFTNAEEERLINLLTFNVGQILGLSTNLFPHYRNSETGVPWGSSYKSVTCTDGSPMTLAVPNILQQGTDERANKYFQVISPSVVQTVRNHFDCQMIAGARLENKPHSRSCFGAYFDERFYFQENFAPLKTFRKVLTPLTLALLEDSSWYRANFTASAVPAFGHGMGCGFLQGDCILFNTIPKYAKNHFCVGQDYGCDVSHSHKAKCDASVDKMGSIYEDTDHCPIKSRNVISCQDVTQAPSHPFEIFGQNSRCFETSKQNSICLDATCNAQTRKVEFQLNGVDYACEGGEVVDSEMGFDLECPQLRAICPELTCPSSCSGRGMCDYTMGPPICICDDPFDQTEGCYMPP